MMIFPLREREREKKSFTKENFLEKKKWKITRMKEYIYTVLTSGVVNFVIQLLR